MTKLVIYSLFNYFTEYGYTYKITEKSNIYSFGVILMELVKGKKPVESEFGESKDIVHWVHNEMRSNDDMISLVDPSISEKASIWHILVYQ
ncbi:putative protein kinase RLK-Pelle-LRR-XI-1 family [Helianthus annuus]|nr:putative protein kinase RLK-Pelle-LRR-XI-1 family [Helianthus annuus]